MNDIQDSGAFLEQANALLSQNAPVADILKAVQSITPESDRYASAQHVRARCAMREGDHAAAKLLLLEAIRGGDATRGVWLNLATVGGALGMPDDILNILSGVLPRIDPNLLPKFSMQALHAMSFVNYETGAWKDKTFDRFVVPLMALLLERNQMDPALRLEQITYEYYIKGNEVDLHFARCMEKLEPLFTAAGLRFRAPPNLTDPRYAERPYRVGFFIHNASMLAHVEVLLNALKGYRQLPAQPFVTTVYCFSGKSLEMERALAELGVRLVMLEEVFPETTGSTWQRLLRLRALLREEAVHELVWVSLVVHLPLAFGMRMAPVQTWWAMKYRSLAQDDIDGYLTGSALTKFSTIGGRRWRMSQLGVDDWYDATLEHHAAAIRADFGGQTILMTLARAQKMQDPEYLRAIVAILQANPDTVFLWAGKEESATVATAFEAGVVADRTRYIGWVPTRLYAQVGDIFLDTFPFPCGFTLFQAMAAGKPAVIYDSPESDQVGLWSFLKPLVEGGEGSADQRAELMTFMGPPDSPNIAVAKSADVYVQSANRLIRDAAFRQSAGEMSRRFMDRYFSDPRAMGASVSDHLVELIEQRFKAGIPE
jgi:hypothetical protein